MHYSNQLLNFEEPYLRISDGYMMESYAMKRGKEAFVINKVLPLQKATSYRTREELEEMFQRPVEGNEKLYYLYPQKGMMFLTDEINLSSEQQIKEKLQENIAIQLKKLAEQEQQNFSFSLFEEEDTESLTNPSSLPADFTTQFMKNSIDHFAFSDYKFHYPMFGNASMVLVRTNQVGIKAQGVDAYFENLDRYVVDTFEAPITPYSLEQLNSISSFSSLKDPKISLKRNPDISREDLKEAKQMVKSLRR